MRKMFLKPLIPNLNQSTMQKVLYPVANIQNIINLLNHPQGVDTKQKGLIINFLETGGQVVEEEQKPEPKTEEKAPEPKEIKSKKKGS